MVICMDHFEGQDLNYLLRHFGKTMELSKIKVYVASIFINQVYKALSDKFEIDDIYGELRKITYEPEFEQIVFTEEGIVYQLEKFKKSKTFGKYPVELYYTRKLKSVVPISISNTIT